MSCRSSLYILEINPSSGIWVANSSNISNGNIYEERMGRFNLSHSQSQEPQCYEEPQSKQSMYRGQKHQSSSMTDKRDASGGWRMCCCYQYAILPWKLGWLNYTNIFIMQQIFIEILLCADIVLGGGYTGVNKNKCELAFMRFSLCGILMFFPSLYWIEAMYPWGNDGDMGVGEILSCRELQQEFFLCTVFLFAISKLLFLQS